MFSRETFRAAPSSSKRGLLASLLFSAIILIWAKAKSGDYLDAMTDHFHHARATWTFFVVGIDVYTHPFGELAARVPYPQTWVTWPHHPVAYPPGMFVVFTLPALVGRFIPLSTLEFGKLVIAYLLVFMHAGLWAFASISRRLESRFWTAVVVFVWIFSVRAALLGFYDGAWLLTGALGVHAMLERRDARAVLWFVASALLSYRAACLAPIALIAFIRLMRTDAPTRTKVVVSGVSAVASLVVIACFAALVRHGPSEGDGAHGLSFASFHASFMLVLGLATAIAVGRGASVLVGSCIALSSLLSIPHAGHNWHGFICIAPLLAMPLTGKPPLWSQVLVGLWFVVFLQFLFGYPPLLWFEELLKFVQRNGTPPLY